MENQYVLGTFSSCIELGRDGGWLRLSGACVELRDRNSFRDIGQGDRKSELLIYDEKI
jgi:hypothetical protein